MTQKKKTSAGLGQLLIPLVALGLLIVFNLFRDIGFFSIGMRVNNSGNIVLTGNLISIIDSASELAIISMGMTMVTAACGGQDISVGAVGAISGAVFVKVMQGMGGITPVSVIATPQLKSPIISSIGKTIPGIPVPTPIFAVILVGLLLALVFRLTSLSLYTQSVGINQGAARLNGINPTVIKLLSFVLLGVCVSVAGLIGVCRLGQLNHKTLLVDIEMDAILAVAIGGNDLGGGRFRLTGSILGAYIIQMLTTTLYAMNVAPVNVKAYKAIVIIIIVVAGSPVVKNKLTALWNQLHAGSAHKAAQKEGVS